MLLVLIGFYHFVFHHYGYFLSGIFPLLQLLYAHLIMLLLLVSYCITLNSLSVSCWTLMPEMLVWQMQLWQVNYAILSYTRQRYRAPTLLHLMSIHRKILLFISSINPYLSKVFVVLLSANIPNSCLLLTIAIFNRINFYFQLIVTLICVLLFTNIFVAHLVFAKLNTRLAETAKRFVSIPVYRSMAPRTRIKLAFFIDSTYTKRRHGITYWKFGLISMASFSKVTYLHSLVHSNLVSPIVCLLLHSISHVSLSLSAA